MDMNIKSIRISMVAAYTVNLFMAFWMAVIWNITTNFVGHMSMVAVCLATAHITWMALHIQPTPEEIQEYRKKDWQNFFKPEK
ncbi:MAG: hypothetical protein B7X39_14205 [Lysobacterales bacterium 14-68-21]|jgi:hypothetical protein|nr:MAG: hypothetical protein B7X45_13095 [Xanthomonadales bacterium 15-68-25]OZB65399.1 MAG: hypothetical protein B7X39_14205 [Xanthomonadales bacterium 14-68-21]